MSLEATALVLMIALVAALAGLLLAVAPSRPTGQPTPIAGLAAEASRHLRRTTPAGLPSRHQPGDALAIAAPLRQRLGARMSRASTTSLSRRAALGAVAATGLATSSVGLDVAVAQQGEPKPHRIAVGQAEVIVISDGPMEQFQSLMLPDRDDDAISAVFQRQGLAYNGFTADNKAVIIRTGAETILVDAGAGPDFMPTLGRLYDNLEAAGIKPEAITKVIFTHGHADHFWGIVDPLSNDTLYEKAVHLMSEAELAFWQHPDVVERHADAFRGMAMGTARRLKAMLPRLKAAKPGAEIAPGVALVDTAGHTPGHVSVLVRSGSDQLLIGGDALVQSVISFAEPGWRWGPDIDPDQAIRSRNRLLDMLATTKTRLVGFHFPWPGAGLVERNGQAFRFVPA